MWRPVTGPGGGMKHTMSSNKYQRMSSRAGQKKPVDSDLLHTTDLNMCFTCICDDTRLQITFVLQHAPFANNFRTLPLNVCACGSHGSHLLITELVMLCIEALTVQILCRCAQAADIPVCQFSMGYGHCLMDPHNIWNWGHVNGHLCNCFFNFFFAKKKLLDCCVCLLQHRKQRCSIRNVCPFAH